MSSICRNIYGWPCYSLRREFITESFLKFNGAYFLHYFDEYKKTVEDKINVENLSKYKEYKYRIPNSNWNLKIPRVIIAKILLELMRALNELHMAGEIHGDIKPSNILVSSNEIHLIDSLKLKSESLSAGLTKGWCAPEQIISEEVDFATDQYPIGLMFLSLIEGTIYGELSEFLIPTNFNEIEKYKIFKNPKVYIDEKKSYVKNSQLEEWKLLIEKCLKFSPKERFSNEKELLSGLNKLIEKDSINGEIEIPISFGLPSIGINDNGQESFCWLIK